MAQPVDRDVNGALRARFDEVYGQYQRLRSGLDELQRKLTTLRVTAESGDGRVRATVGPRGQLIALSLDPGIYRDGDADALALTITRTIQEATARSVDHVHELVAGYLPHGSAAAEYLKDNDFGTLLRRQDAVMRPDALARGEAGDA